MVTEYIVPIIIFLFIGGAAGVALTFASRTFEIESDETVNQILSKLPGINCGACGLSSCEAYAEAVRDGVFAPNLCKPGGIESAQGIGEVLGIEVIPGERETAFVHCAGVTTEDKYIYAGTKSCVAAGRYYNGKGNCKTGCLGLGDCADVCAYDAITFKNGAAVVDRQRCWACGLCVYACPNNLISLRKHSERVKVMCKSCDTMKETRAICGNGCIACNACVKKCLTDAIKIEDNCAVIDYEICTSCGVCAMICPVKCIAVDGYKRAAANLNELNPNASKEVLPM
ncbi:MAG: RnfABCDGE type electron transport complex subunit B [Oscillospiraceae bacterium]|jgi:Na+-translocating ferredoxin:NAD+ oxidoreductase RNF subunit RnfB|nr:RnfABCDGE type electron transport complex subunit B [Oscillospiraceae bacterium]